MLASLFKARLLPLLLLLSLQHSAHAERLPIRTYTVADGLVHDVINKIVRDSHGFLWFCTDGGLSRFDGYEFKNYGTEQGLPHTTVNTLLETPNGELWIGTGAGLVRFDPLGTANSQVVYEPHVAGNPAPMFTTIVPADQNRRARAVTVILETHDGNLWVGTYKGLYRLQTKDGRRQLEEVEIGLPSQSPEQRLVNDLVEDASGSLWIATPSGLYRHWPDGATDRYTMKEGLPADHLHDLLIDHDGQLWVASRTAGFFRLAVDQTRARPVLKERYGLDEGLGTNWVFQLFETSDRDFWIATNKGLAAFSRGDGNEQRFRAYTMRNGLSYHEITAVNEDAGGNLWLGTNITGVMKLAPDGFVTYDERDGIAGIGAIFGDHNRGVCFRGYVLGDEHATVFEGAKLDVLRPSNVDHFRYGRFDGQRFTWFVPTAPRTQNFGWVNEGVTLQGRNGEWWLGTGEGLYRFPPADDFTKIKFAHPLAIYQKELPASQQVFRLFEDARGDIWASTIATPNRLARWDRASQTFLPDLANSPDLPSPTEDLARAFGEDRAGNIWIGFGTGVARYRNGVFTFFTARDRLPPGAIQDIYTDQQGRLWLASARGGLVRIDDPTAERPIFTTYTNGEGLSSNLTEAITEDRDGRIYVSTGHGLDQLDPDTKRIRHFTTADGLAEGGIVTAFRDQQGTLWFGTAKGLSRFAPGGEKPPAPPPILVTGLRIAGERQTVSALGETKMMLPNLAPDQNQIQIDFVGLSFTSGDELLYQYRLEGADADWSTPTEQRRVTYARLAPGSYKFLVRAVNSEGLASVAPAIITFTVLQPIWQRWWFLLLAAFATAALAYAFYRYRVARMLEVANMRTRIATDLHDEIGSNLSLIAMIGEAARRRASRDAQMAGWLSTIAGTSRETVDAMSDIVWAVNPGKDRLIDLTQRMRRVADELLSTRDMDLSFNAPGAADDIKLDAETRREVFMIFKEALNNAVRHSQGSRVTIDFRVETGRLLLNISDNGKGFDTHADAGGNGLANMRRRADKVQGRLEIDSKADAGTTIRLNLPVDGQRRFRY